MNPDILGGTNAFGALKSMLADRPAAVGTVISSYSDGTAKVEMRGGGERRVRAAWAVGTGDEVLVQNGVAASAAPALSSSTIDLG